MPDGSIATGLRGDYTAMAADWTVPQSLQAYDSEDRDVWRLLVRRQTKLARRHACAAFLDGLAAAEIGDDLPEFDRVSERLERLTGWRLVGVPGLIPDAAFHGLLARRRFPVTVWLRRRRELDYLVEPDLFHDFFGHVPLLADPVFADCMQAFGRLGAAAAPADLPYLARLYWRTVEFGLVREGGGLKVFGAGIVSSSAETVVSVESTAPQRLAFDALRCLRTRYDIDRMQDTYFVLDGFAKLFEALSADLAALAAEARARPELGPAERLPGETAIAPNRPACTAASGPLTRAA